MNSLKLYSAAILIVLLGILVAPGSEATGLFVPFLTPLHVFAAAKYGTMALLKKGAILGGLGLPLVAKKAILGKAAVVGGVAGTKTGLLTSSAKAPIFLAKSALPNLLSLAPLLKGKKHTRTAPKPVPAPLPPPAKNSYAPPPPAYNAPILSPVSGYH